MARAAEMQNDAVIAETLTTTRHVYNRYKRRLTSHDVFVCTITVVWTVDVLTLFAKQIHTHACTHTRVSVWREKAPYICHTSHAFCRILHEKNDA